MECPVANEKFGTSTEVQWTPAFSATATAAFCLWDQKTQRTTSCFHWCLLQLNTFNIWITIVDLLVRMLFVRVCLYFSKHQAYCLHLSTLFPQRPPPSLHLFVCSQPPSVRKCMSYCHRVYFYFFNTLGASCVHRLSYCLHKLNPSPMCKKWRNETDVLFLLSTLSLSLSLCLCRLCLQPR